jgi:hypothetical protein
MLCETLMRVAKSEMGWDVEAIAASGPGSSAVR